MNTNENPDAWERRRQKHAKKGVNLQKSLSVEIKKSVYPTPRSMDAVPTPTAFDAIGSSKTGLYGAPLTKKLCKESGKYPTPRAFDGEIQKQWDGEEKMEDSNYSSMLCSALGNFSSKSWVNPEFSEWLMGWPIGWTLPGPLNKGIFDGWKDRAREGLLWSGDSGVEKLVEIKSEEHENEIKARLKAIGNGQVPLCVYVIWKLLEAGGAIKNGKFMKNTKPKIQAIIRGK